MGAEGVEPTRPCGHKVLSLARLPVTPSPHTTDDPPTILHTSRVRVSHRGPFVIGSRAVRPRRSAARRGAEQGAKRGPASPERDARRRDLTNTCDNTYYGFVPRALQEELKQTRPFELLEEEVYLSVIRTAAALERRFSQVLKPFGLTHTQYNVLRILRGAGGAGLCRNEVGARLLREVPDVTRLLDRLKQMRLIRRQRSGTDRREVRSHITQKGLDVLAELDLHVRKAHRDHLAHVSPPRLRVLAELLADVRNAGP